MKTAQEIMTKEVVCVDPEMPLIKAVAILLKRGFNGLPVTIGKTLVGLITEYDMIIKGSSIHLPTFVRLFEKIDFYKKDAGPIKDDLKAVFSTKVRDVMNIEPLTLTPETSIFKVVDTFAQHHKINPIPIVDANKQVVGIISRSDVIKFLGDASLKLEESAADLEENISKFLNNFESSFILVKKSRTKFWIMASILFAIVGFIIAWALILRFV